MGWGVAQISVTVTKDEHAGELEREHDLRWCELQWRVESAVMAGRYDTLNPTMTDHECDLTSDNCEATKRAAKWRHVVALLAEAQRTVDGEDFGAYVDVSSAVEALEELLDDARWKAFETAGPEAAGSRRVVDGQPLTFTEFWDRQGEQ